MPLTKYVFSVSTDFSQQKVNSDKFTDEINNSSILTNISHINIKGDVCDIWFENELSTEDNTLLNNIVSTHDGDNVLIKTFVEDRKISSTSGTIWIPKINKTLDFIQSGTYKIFWCYFWKAYAGTAEISTRMRIYKHGTTPVVADTVFIHRQKPASISYQSIPSFGFSFKNLDSGIYVVDLYFKREGTLGTVQLSDVSISLKQYSHDQLASVDLTGTTKLVALEQAIKAIEL